MNIGSGSARPGKFIRSVEDDSRFTAVSNLDQHCEPGPKRCVARLPLEGDQKHASNEEWRIEARLCGDGSGKAARDRQQGWKSESRRRTQGELQPLIQVRNA